MRKQLLYTSIGRRKKAVARAELTIQTSPLSVEFEVKNKILVNNCSVEKYFHFNVTYIQEVSQPLRLLTQLQLERIFYLKPQFNCMLTIHGGGLSGQASAIKLAIARSILSASKDDLIISSFKRSGLLTRNDKCKERKK